MTHGVLTPSDRGLAGAVDDVRTRWRLKHALWGGTIAVVGAFAVFVALSLLMKALHYGDAIVRQTLMLPQGAVGLQLGSQTVPARTLTARFSFPFRHRRCWCRRGASSTPCAGVTT